jgi:hypothetical protein
MKKMHAWRYLAVKDEVVCPVAEFDNAGLRSSRTVRLGRAATQTTVARMVG